jgi:RNA polymerase sigma factor (sigma-70 family)
MKPSNQYYRNNENLRFTMVTAEQEKQLFKDARAGDETAREFLIKNHLLFCANFGRKRNRGLQDDEVISAVNAALMKAIDEFNPDYGSRFTRYLVPFLRGAIANLWKSKNLVRVPTPKDPEFSSQSRFSHYDDAAHEADSARAGETDAGEATRWAAPAPTRCEVTNLLATEDLGEEIAESDFKGQILPLLAKCRSALTPEEQHLLTEVYENNKSFTQVGLDCKPPVSRQAIHQAHGRVMTKLRAALMSKAK